MSSVPSGKRNWKCPECGSDVLLSMTQLDPIACDTCLGKMKGQHGSKTVAAEPSLGPLSVWQALPETTKLAIAAIGFIVGLLIGLAVGYAAGKASAPRSAVGVSSEEERPDPPGPGYKWVRGRERKDGTRGDGHWAKDPYFKGEDGPTPKKK